MPKKPKTELVFNIRLQLASTFQAAGVLLSLSSAEPFLVFPSPRQPFLMRKICKIFTKSPRLYLFVDLYLLSTYNARIIRVEISFDPTLRLEKNSSTK